LCERHWGRYVFIHPWCFGKSTFLATLQRILDGSVGIFNGTQIHWSNYKWNRYWVLYLDLGGLVIEDNCHYVIATNHTLLEHVIRRTLEKFAADCKLLYPNISRVVNEFRDIMTMNKEEKRSQPSS